MGDVLTPIDHFLAEQQDSTAVARFSRRHDRGSFDAQTLAAGVYADRLPGHAPGVGEQYAFQVDLDQCTGCKACVAGCHSLNGLDEGESWRSVGQLVGVEPEAPRLQTVPSGCHHCVDPACLSGCPTNAYEKDPFSGIVRHLDDQCFGCGYCELTCPYEVPKLNKRLGVVRKCDMCADRLAEGEAPACVQACPTSAITITVVDTQEAVADAQGSVLVPGAPDSAITVPTTRYITSRPLADEMVSADQHALHPSEAHPPLAFMLVLTQASVGAFVIALALGWDTLAAATVGAFGLAGAFFHLGRPTVAWRAVLGVRHSWFSREVLALGGYAGVAMAHGVATATAMVPDAAETVAGAVAAAAGLVGVACSAQLYVVTRRTWWRPRFTFTKFFGTATVLGPILAATVAAGGADPSTLRVLVALSAAALAAKVADEAWLLRRDRHDEGTDLARTSRLLRGPLATSSRWRFGSAAVGLGLLAVSVGTAAVGAMAVALAAVVAGELIERYQFFVASVAPRMPGGFRR